MIGLIKFPHIKVRLFAKDNPIAILGRTIKAMRLLSGAKRHAPLNVLAWSRAAPVQPLAA